MLICEEFLLMRKGKSKPHMRSVHWVVPVREDTYHGHQLYEVGWPVHFLAIFISPVFPPGPNSLLDGQ